MLDTGGSGGGDDVAGTGGEDNQTETVDLPEVAEASHALMQVCAASFFFCVAAVALSLSLLFCLSRAEQRYSLLVLRPYLSVGIR